jgi:hypothetical protein
MASGQDLSIHIVHSLMKNTGYNQLEGPATFAVRSG